MTRYGLIILHERVLRYREYVIVEAEDLNTAFHTQVKKRRLPDRDPDSDRHSIKVESAEEIREDAPPEVEKDKEESRDC